MIRRFQLDLSSCSGCPYFKIKKYANGYKIFKCTHPKNKSTRVRPKYLFKKCPFPLVEIAVALAVMQTMKDTVAEKLMNDEPYSTGC